MVAVGRPRLSTTATATLPARRDAQAKAARRARAVGTSGGSGASTRSVGGRRARLGAAARVDRVRDEQVAAGVQPQAAAPHELRHRGRDLADHQAPPHLAGPRGDQQVDGHARRRRSRRPGSRRSRLRAAVDRHARATVVVSVISRQVRRDGGGAAASPLAPPLEAAAAMTRETRGPRNGAERRHEDGAGRERRVPEQLRSWRHLTTDLLQARCASHGGGRPPAISVRAVRTPPCGGARSRAAVVGWAGRGRCEEECVMKAIVVYESLWGNTAEVARAVAEGLGPDARALRVDEAGAGRRRPLRSSIVAGAPVFGFKLSSPQMRDGIRKNPGKGPAPDLSCPPLLRVAGGAGAGLRLGGRVRHPGARPVRQGRARDRPAARGQRATRRSPSPRASSSKAATARSRTARWSGRALGAPSSRAPYRSGLVLDTPIPALSILPWRPAAS